MKIGIIAGAFKPLTKGHIYLINQAEKENEKVYLFVSTSDRIRKDEYPIYWEQMKIIWEQYTIPFLSSKIEIFFVSNPIASLYDHLKKIDENIKNKDVYTFYADENDIKHIDNQRIKTSLPRIAKNKQLKTKSFNRQNNINVSGTMARKAIKESNKDYFKSMLPDFQQNEIGDLVYEILKRNQAVYVY